MSKLKVGGQEINSEARRAAGWLAWAERHPAYVLLGLLFAATLFLAREPARTPLEVDVLGEDVPLFV